jgi:two-component system NtrC family sensor kinase
MDFLREVSKMLLDFSGCDTVELRVMERNKYYRCETTHSPKRPFRSEIKPCVKNEDGELIPGSQDDSDLEQLCKDVFRGRFDPSLPFFTRRGSFWTEDAGKPFVFRKKTDERSRVRSLHTGGECTSLAIIPIAVDNQNIGLLQLKSKQLGYFTNDEVEFYEGIAQTLGIALTHRSAQVRLRERIKELTCLYGIAQVAAKLDISLEEILQGIVELLPPAWLYPDIASARIILDEHSYSTPNFQEGAHKQTADIVVGRQRRGVVELIYAREKPDIDEGPFLKEERKLIDTIAREVALVIERRKAEEDKSRLQDQLRHADRLATIGQLSAGVAHELNEPLGNILGFAQLAKKCPGLPKQAEQDIEKMITASLYAREVIKKLMVFARQMPPRKTKVNLNQIVEDGLYFLESRFAKEGVELVRSLSPDLPDITADPAQLQQVLVNLVVNAVQAMPGGGRLTIQTLASEGHVSLIVEDTGIGMGEEVKKQIFMPFFTTKEVGQGTGLGLPVVHGIVTSHGGSIKVESEVSHGTWFEIELPVTELQNLEDN